MSQARQAAVSWSGGKDSCLSLYRAVRSGVHARFLLNMVNRDASRSMSHGLTPLLLSAQAEAIQIPIVQRETTWETYERDFKAAVTELRREGAEAMVFGDIDLVEHQEWVERVSHEVGVEAMLPLWGCDSERLLNEFVESGFEAVVVAANAEFFGEDWLGKRLDRRFVADVARLAGEAGFHPLGEKGEYHTFVVDGPLFKRRIRIGDAHKVLREGYRFLDIVTYDVQDK
ncbi:MAG: diphthine--ammonia ligase [Chloroflexota bacterium]|nr:diphthine--ammonia ligase [Chloroflexota bacterium]